MCVIIISVFPIFGWWRVSRSLLVSLNKIGLPLMAFAETPDNLMYEISLSSRMNRGISFFRSGPVSFCIGAAQNFFTDTFITPKPHAIVCMIW